ncbi:MAG: hypothetical protein ABJ340_03120 [Paraglaciecola sp.]|uniref:hypothetical protein n=1 Tax=Paraglaciecola sp. TaxID=1920173 RepID=UPI00329A6175
MCLLKIKGEEKALSAKKVILRQRVGYTPQFQLSSKQNIGEARQGSEVRNNHVHIR